MTWSLHSLFSSKPVQWPRPHIDDGSPPTNPIPASTAGVSRSGHRSRESNEKPEDCAVRQLDQPRARDLFSVTAARIRVFNAFSSILSPSWKSMARRVLPSRLALKRPDGSSSAAPLAKVIFTTFLYVSPVQINPS